LPAGSEWREYAVGDLHASGTTIHEFSGGIARTVNAVCDNALASGWRWAFAS
jgi:hypothetical protein